MNVEIGTVAAQFSEKENINDIFVAVHASEQIFKDDANGCANFLGIFVSIFWYWFFAMCCRKGCRGGAKKHLPPSHQHPFP
jgi:hypothetical protein